MTKAVRPPRTRRRKVLYSAVLAGAIGLAGLLVLEVSFRFKERTEASRTFHEGPGAKWVMHPRWGWHYSKGAFRIGTPEFTMSGDIDDRFMNGPAAVHSSQTLTNVLCLGDSHTFAVGVSSVDTWVARLQAKLNAQEARFQFFNAGTAGYSLHQSLLRLIDQGPEIHPGYVIVGLSYATDLFDLRPPHAGGWTYGGNTARDYFEVEGDELVLQHWSPVGQVAEEQAASAATRVRSALGSLATFRQLRRSRLALWFGSNVRVSGQSLWPNMEVVFEREPSVANRYVWQLFEGLLAGIQRESARQGARLIIVGIPYLPQVYDDIWNATFAGDARLSRTAAIERVSAWCKAQGVPYVDTLDALKAETKRLGRWVHWPRDAHPTPEGHEAIAETVLRSGHIVLLHKPAHH